ncbi:hypothetical protein MP631_18535 [Xanthomonas phaseoli pv. phaseoli]|nr:hypothetical protein MP631_18535 [Xanthomonas phaseoli pv. phaseoli]
MKVVLTDEEGSEVVAWIDLEQRTSSAKAMLKAFLREQARVVEVDARGFAALGQQEQEMTIPWAFSLPWANPALRAALLILYIQFLAQLEALLAQHESEALEEIKELKARLAVIEDAAKTVTLLKAEIRAAAIEASLPAGTNAEKARLRF